jgi:hypothetical protein
MPATSNGGIIRTSPDADIHSVIFDQRARRRGELPEDEKGYLSY